MGAASELPFVAESVSSVVFAERALPVQPQYVPDEEFPADLPVQYDWMLQPASQRSFRRAVGFLAGAGAGLLIAVSLCLVYRPPVWMVSVSVGLAVVVLVAVTLRVLPAVFGE